MFLWDKGAGVGMTTLWGEQSMWSQYNEAHTARKLFFFFIWHSPTKSEGAPPQNNGLYVHPVNSSTTDNLAHYYCYDFLSLFFKKKSRGGLRDFYTLPVARAQQFEKFTIQLLEYTVGAVTQNFCRLLSELF